MSYYKKNESGEYEEVKPARVFETQVELDDFMKERVHQVEKKFADYDGVKQQLADANKRASDLETGKKTLEEQLQEKSKEVEKEKLNTARVGIRHSFGLSEDMDKFLIGDTEDEIRANAELLKKGGSGAGVKIDKKTETPPAESPSKKLAGSLFGPKGE